MLKRAVMSKVTVCLALLSLAVGAFYVVSNASAANQDSDFSQVYQYYLLSNDGGHDHDDEKPKEDQSPKQDDKNKAPGTKTDEDKDTDNSKMTKWIKGALGNGGNQGTFSYQDIINGAADPHQARRFSEMMATLSGYNYISVQSNGITSIFPILGHFFVGIILLAGGFMLDIFTALWNGIVKLISEYNVFTLLASAFSASDTGQAMANALGLSGDQIKEIMATLMLVFIAVILFTLVKMLRHGGSNIDGNDRRKFVGRLIGFISLPIVIVMAAAMLQDAAGLTGSNSDTAPSYSNWLMDVKDWAFKDNFDTRKADGLSNLNADASNGKFVDTSFNPYATTAISGVQGGPAAAIGKSLFENSDIQGSLFPNSSMALSYMSSQTFDARAYLQYIEANKIGTYFGNFGPDDTHSSSLYTFDKGRTSTGDGKNTDVEKFWAKNSPMDKAKTDYINGSKTDKDGEKIYASKEKTWADRFIYGAKNDGSLKDYYKNGPSKEQIFSGAGGGEAGKALTYESTFLALSTNFNVDGGQFMLDGPTYGAYASIPSFDSKRMAYYNYSMVGNCMFTIPAMLSEAFMTILVAMAVIVTMWSIGIIDMFVRPFRAWIKACSFGDIEYTEAELVYSLGVVGTVLYVAMAPGILLGLFKGAAGIVGHLMTNTSASANGAASNVFVSEMAGSSYWLAFGFALAGNILFIRDAAFRDKLIEILSIPWNWARGKAEQLEEMVSDGSIARGAQGKREAVKRRRGAQAGMLMAMNNNENALTKGLNKLTHNKAGDLAEKGLELMNQTGAYQDDSIKPDGIHTKKELTAQQLRRQGAMRRMGKGMRKLGMLPGMNPALINKDFNQKGKDAMKPENLMNPDGTFNTDNKYASNALADKMRGFNADIYGNLTPEEIQRLRELQEKQARGETLSPEEQAELEGLQDRAAQSNELVKGADQLTQLEDKGMGLSPAEMDRLQELQEKQAQGAKLSPQELSELRRLQEKESAVNGLSPAEEATLAGYQNTAHRILGDKDSKVYNNLLTKEAKGIPLTNHEKETMQTLEKKLKDKGMPDKAVKGMHKLSQRKLGPLTKKERIDLKKLQGLRRSEALRVPLSAEQLVVYRTLQQKFNDGVQADMDPAKFELLTKLENQTTPLTPQQAQQYVSLKQEANQIGRLHLKPQEQATYKRLDQQARPLMRTGQKAQLEQLTKRATRNLNEADRSQLTQTRRSINAVQKSMQNAKSQIIKSASDPRNLAQAKDERIKSAKNVKRQLRQLQNSYSQLQSRQTERAAADFTQQLVRTREFAKGSHDDALQAAVKTIGRQAQEELNNFTFAPSGSIDMNQNGIADDQEGFNRQRSLKSVNADLARLDTALGDLEHDTTNSLNTGKHAGGNAVGQMPRK